MMTTVKRVARGLAMMTAASLLGLAGAEAQEPQPVVPCRPPQVIPLKDPEPAPKLFVQQPLAEPLATRGVVVIPYCAEHMRLASVFGPAALAVSPRVGHVHVTVDDAPWHWADASGNPLILRGMPKGAHTVLIELVDANHQVVDKDTVTFSVP